MMKRARLDDKTYTRLMEVTGVKVAISIDSLINKMLDKYEAKFKVKEKQQHG